LGNPNTFDPNVLVGRTAAEIDAMTHGSYVVVSQIGTKTKVPMAGNPTLNGGC
jgi:hypothetical protein